VPNDSLRTRKDRRWYAGRVVRLLSIFAKLYLLLSLAGGVPPAHAFERGADAPDAPSAQEAIRFKTLGSTGLPAEVAALREGARTNFAAGWRSLQLQLGILPGGVIVPAPVASGTPALAFGASFAPVPFPSSSVRGPPPAI
jgi:hypothetical protein